MMALFGFMASFIFTHGSKWNQQEDCVSLTWKVALSRVLLALSRDQVELLRNHMTCVNS